MAGKCRPHLAHRTICCTQVVLKHTGLLFRSQIIRSDGSLMAVTSTPDYVTKAYYVIWNDAKLNTAADNSYTNILFSCVIHSDSNISRIYPQQPQTTSMPKQSRIQYLTLRLLMSYIYRAPILDVSRSHTTTHHSR